MHDAYSFEFSQDVRENEHSMIPSARKFYDLVVDAVQELYPGIH